MNNKIVLIEDNDDDVLMIRRAFNKGRIGNDIYRCENGREGLDYLLSDEGKNVDLILLDLNMEVMNGFDFLEEFGKIHNKRHIPVVVLTSSHRDEDICKAYDLGANSYVEKPIDPKEFISKVLSIEDFWIYVSLKPAII